MSQGPFLSRSTPNSIFERGSAHIQSVSAASLNVLVRSDPSLSQLHSDLRLDVVGRCRPIIPLERVERVRRSAMLDDVNFLLHIDDGGRPVPLLDGAHTGNRKRHNLLGQTVLAHRRVPYVEEDAGS